MGCGHAKGQSEAQSSTSRQDRQTLFADEGEMTAVFEQKTYLCGNCSMALMVRRVNGMMYLWHQVNEGMECSDKWYELPLISLKPVEEPK
jgi:hypothetical protein